MRHQVTPQHLQFLPVFEADDIVGLDRGADRNGGLQFFRCSFGGRAEARQRGVNAPDHIGRSEEHTSELQSLMRISYAVFCLKKKKTEQHTSSRNNSKLEIIRN